MTLTSPKSLMVLVFLFALLAMAYVAAIEPALAGVASSMSHANMRHGSDADLARSCRGNGYLFHNPITDRYANVCQINDAFGVYISEANGEEVTSFMKNKMHRFEQVLQYMKNQGYSLVH